MLDPVDGAVFLHELQRLEQYEFEHDWAEARAEHAERATADRLARTAEQRRADALTEMARGSAARPDQTVPARPLFTVLVGYDAFTHLCELADGTVVHPGQLVPYLTEADIERVVPAERCQIDHIVPHSQGGLTTQANGRCYCAVHNRQKGDRADAVDPIDPLDDG
jgi:5-methylcytosine-specific restriction endonuclease McrA